MPASLIRQARAHPIRSAARRWWACAKRALLSGLPILPPHGARCGSRGGHGTTERTVEIVTGTAIWHHPGRYVPIAYVLVRDPTEEFRPQAFLATDTDADPVDILRWFVRRWSVEVTFAEVRRHLGVETQRQWTDKAIARTTPCLLALFSLVALWSNDLPRSALTTRTAPGTPNRSRPCIPAAQRSTICRVFDSRCQRSAVCTACGAPAVMPRVYSVERSRATVAIPGRARSHAARVPAVRSGSRSRASRRSRSTMIVP